MLAYKLITVAAAALLVCSSCAQDGSAPHADSGATRGYNNSIPERIMTPDTVKTRIGTLRFVDGVPTAETTQAVYDHLD